MRRGAVCAPAVCIPAAVRAMRETRIGIGAENCNANASGAYTGEIAANMLLDAGCNYVILGHSERRAMGETNATSTRKGSGCPRQRPDPHHASVKALSSAKRASPRNGSPCRSRPPCLHRRQDPQDDHCLRAHLAIGTGRRPPRRSRPKRFNASTSVRSSGKLYGARSPVRSPSSTAAP